MKQPAWLGQCLHPWQHRSSVHGFMAYFSGKEFRMTRSKKGFTLIELLIVVVIIGILAAIAIPKFAVSKEQAFVANMKSDLRNLVTAQEGYFYDNNTYYNGPVPDATRAFKTSSPVSITLTNVTAGGWAATATH